MGIYIEKLRNIAWNYNGEGTSEMWIADIARAVEEHDAVCADAGMLIAELEQAKNLIADLAAANAIMKKKLEARYEYDEMVRGMKTGPSSALREEQKKSMSIADGAWEAMKSIFSK